MQKIVNKLSRTHIFSLCLQENGLRSSQDTTVIQNSHEMHRKTNDIDSPEDSYTFKNGISLSLEESAYYVLTVVFKWIVS